MADALEGGGGSGGGAGGSMGGGGGGMHHSKVAAFNRWSEHPEAAPFAAKIRQVWSEQGNDGDGDGDGDGVSSSSSSSGSGGGALVAATAGQSSQSQDRELCGRLVGLLRGRLAYLEAADTSAGCGGALSLLGQWVRLTGSSTCSGGSTAGASGSGDGSDGADGSGSLRLLSSPSLGWLGAQSRVIACRHLCERWLGSAAVLDRASHLLSATVEALHAAESLRRTRNRTTRKRQRGGGSPSTTTASEKEAEACDCEAVGWLVDRMQPRALSSSLHY